MPEAPVVAAAQEAQNHGRLGLALLLAGLAGWVDAVGIAGSNGVFVSFMSGNTTDLGVALSRQDWSRGGQIAVVLGLFVAGAMAGELLEPLGGRRGPSLVLGVEALLLAVGAATQANGFAMWNGLRLPAALSCCPLVFAMGLQNATMHRAGGISIGLTYVTGTLVQIGRALVRRLRGEVGQRVFAYVGVWSSLAAGAGAGGLALTVSSIAALLAAAAAAGSLALMTAFVPLHPGARQFGRPQEG